MRELIQLLSGKKTYITGLGALILVFGSWQHWWTIPNEAYEALLALTLIFLRAGVSKGPGSPVAQTSSTKLSSLSVLAFACFIFLSGSFFISGCSTTAQQAAYRTAGTTAVSVDTAMKLWGTYVAVNHPPVSQEQAVAKAYGKYQQAMANVCDAGQVYSAAGTNSVYGTPASASLALQSAVANANQEILDLENLIESFGVKLQPSTSTP